MALSFEESKKILAQQAATPMVMSLSHEPEAAVLEANIAPVVGPSEETWTRDYSYPWFDDYYDNKVSFIDQKKSIKVDPSQVNISQEANSQFVPFEMPQKYDGIDLSTMSISFHYIRSDKTHGQSRPVNVEYNGENIRFVWMIDNDATRVPGKLKLEVHADGTIVDRSGKSYGYRWKSNGTDQFLIIPSLCEDTDCEDEVVASSDWVQEIVTDVAAKVADKITEAGIEYQVEAAENAADRAEEAKIAVETVLDNYYTKTESDETIQNVASSLTTYVDDKIDAIPEVDLSGHALKTEIPTVVSELENDAGYLTEHQSLEDYATKQNLQDAIDAIDVTDQLNDYTLKTDIGDLSNEDGVARTVKQYVDDSISAVDVSDQLGDLSDSEGNARTVKEYVDDSVSAVDVSAQLVDYAKSADVYTKTDVDTKVGTLNTSISGLGTVVGELQDTVNGIDTSPRLTYDIVYNDTEDENSGENVLVLYEIENEGKENQIKTPKAKYTIAGGSGGSAASTDLKIYFDKDQNGNNITQYIFTTESVDKNEAVIYYDFVGIDSVGDSVSSANATWQIRKGSSGSWTTIETGTVYPGEDLVFNVSKYISVGAYQLKLSLSDESGGFASKTWSVQNIELKIESTFNDKLTYPIAAVPFTYTPYGAISKDIHFVLDGKELGVVTTTASGIPMAYEIPVQTHGAHLLEVYMMASVNNNDIESNHIVRDIIWCDETSASPVIGVANQKFTARQYDATNIEYVVYDPTTETPTVQIAVDGVVVSTPTLSETVNIYTYKTDVVGDHTITITCGDTVKTIKATITKLDINVEPITAGLVFDFNPSGKSNNDTDRVWTNGTVSMSVSDNFDWINGGYQYDENGDQYFCIKSGTSATIDYKLFADDAKLNGKEFKLVFKTSNVSRPDATFLHCIDNTTGSDHIGIRMDVQEAYIYGQAGSLHLPYSEEDIIEFEFNISKDTEPIPMVMGYEDGVSTRPMVYDDSYNFTQNTPKIISLGSTDCDLHIYRFKVYNVSLTELDEKAILNNFIADARNAEEMIDRYERNQIYDENQNLDPDVLAEKCPWLRVYKLSAPYFTNNKSDKVPNTTIQQIYKNGDPILDNWTCYDCSHSGQGTSSNNYGAAGRNLDFIMNKSQIEGVKPYFILGDGKTRATEITMTRNSVPVAYLNAKVNIASSNNMTNAMFANRYREFNPYKRPFVRGEGEDISFIKDTMEFNNCVIFIQETNDDLTTHREFADKEWHFYALGNIGDSKKTDKTRLTDKNDPYECCIEIMDVELPLSDFPRDTMMNAMGYKEDETTKEKIYTWAKDENLGILYELIDGEYVLTQDETVDLNKTYYVDILLHDDFSEDYTYGWRYISDEDNADVVNYCHQKWIEAYRFITTSTDEEFKAHIGDYFVLDSILYYYLFTTRYTMVDNRAKNTFLHYGKTGEVDADGNPIRKFDLTWAYDMDTSIGLNNYGKQVYRYGLEDTDVDEKGEFVFREADSTFFCRIRDLFPNELKSMYQTLESKNAWHAESFINQADTWQSEFPEELWRLDIKRKYLRTYTGSFINGKADSQFLVNMANGKMKYQRRQWERNQEKYMASKYQSSVASSDNSVLRCAKPTGDLVVAPNYKLKLIPYAYMYLNVKYGTQSPIQVKAEPNVEYEIPYDGTSADIIDIYSSSLLRSFGDLSTCYAATVDTSKASKIKELIIGNETSGYDNPYLTTLTTGANYLLEKLNVENVSGLTQALNLSALNNLKELYAHGSNIGGVTFADGGRIEIAELPAINSLTMKNLIYLANLDITDFSKLTTLTVENCDTVDLMAILNSAENINRIRIVGVDWSLENTNLLDRLYALKGIDKNGYNADRSVVAGKVHVPVMRQQKLREYNEAWPDLEVSYNTLVEQYAVTFVNADGAVLDVQYIDKGRKPVDPITREDNPIATPTLASTVSTNYTFAGWDSAFITVFENLTYTATYTESIREYTIRYMNNGQLAQEPVVAPYGTSVWYAGDVPTYTAEESAYKYYLFDGWDKSGYVDGDKTINAVYETCEYSAGYFDGKDISEMRPVDIYAMTKLGLSSTYVEPKDAITITLGNDINYTDIDQQVLIDKETIFNGSNTYVDTGIKLFDEDKDFVLAIDYSFDKASANGSVLAGCYNDMDSEGFMLWSYGSSPRFNWGSSYVSPSKSDDREMIVIRHIKGETGLHVYTSKTESDGTDYVELSGIHTVMHDGTLVFGCSKALDGSYEKYASGTIYWSKIWYADLGDETCANLAYWPHENMTFEMCGFDRYYLSDGSGKRSSMTFLATGVLSNEAQYGTGSKNAGGWADSTLKTYLNNRIYNALPTKWKQLIKQVRVKSSIGNLSTQTSMSDCYIYIPAVHDIYSNKSNEPYYSEISPASTIEYFALGSTKICYNSNGTAVQYWTRSPNADKDYAIHTVDTTGNLSSYSYPYNTYYVRIMFSI